MLDKVIYSQLIINKDVLNNNDPLIHILIKVEDYLNNINEDNDKLDIVLMNITIFIANIRKLKSSSLIEKYKDILDELEWIKKDLINRLEYYRNLNDTYDK